MSVLEGSAHFMNVNLILFMTLNSIFDMKSSCGSEFKMKTKFIHRKRQKNNKNKPSLGFGALTFDKKQDVKM